MYELLCDLCVVLIWFVMMLDWMVVVEVMWMYMYLNFYGYLIDVVIVNCVFFDEFVEGYFGVWYEV